ncbi:MAG: ABC transporter ATP-binding protein [Bifidobacteriaceae bacterium]|nr:ABC transporter ATP-binding protein [Bifidobacteriaceae bacterium]
MPDSAVRLDAVTFSYGAAAGDSLSDLELDLRPGEFVALTGPSGSGKTTLTRLINGLIPHYYEGVLSGKVLVNGVDPSSHALWRLPVGSVFQNPRAQFFTTDTTSEIAFGAENLGLEAAEILRRVDAAIESMGLEELRDRSVFALSGGEKQRVACASVAAVRPPIYVLDEPSANLDLESTQQLRAIMATWKASGATVVVAEHRLGYLRDLVDRVLIFADGRLRQELGGTDFRRLDEGQLRRLGLRCAWGRPLAVASQAPDRGYLEVSGLRCGYRRVGGSGLATPRRRDVVGIDQLRIPKGAVTALVGANGAGKTTFAAWLGGLRRDRRGTLSDGGRVWKRSERRRRVFLVSQDVNHQLFTEAVSTEIELALRLASPDSGLPAPDAAAIMNQLDISDLAGRHPLSLSAGQKQRVVVAAALASGREVVVLDEPTAGLDLGHMTAVAKALRDLADGGRTVVVATHDADLVAACADNIVRLDHGSLAN